VLEEAAAIVHAGFRNRLREGYEKYCALHPEHVPPVPDWATDDTAFDHIKDTIAGTAEIWPAGEFLDRDADNPAIWIFTVHGGIPQGPLLVYGWEGIASVAHSIGVSHAEWLNVTAVLRKADEGLREILVEREAWRSLAKKHGG
jgi:hypothetical protein